MMTRQKGRRRSQPTGADVGGSVEAIPGYGEVDIRHLVHALVNGEPLAALSETRTRIVAFLKARNVVALLAKSGEQLLRESTAEGQIGPGPSGLEQVHVELLQAFALTAGPGNAVPTSPHSIVRLWKFLQRNLAAYVTSIGPSAEGDMDTDLARRIRLRTIFYRNIFNSDDVMEVVPALLAYMDPQSLQQLGFPLSDFVRALHAIFHTVGERFVERLSREKNLRTGRDVDGVIDAMLQGSPTAERMWRLGGARIATEGGRGVAGFQLAEMLCASLFTFDRAGLVDRFGASITKALFSCALRFGDLAETDLSRIYLDNPIWKWPFIALDANTLFLPMPVLTVSFPFAVIEKFLNGNEILQNAYSAARARYLEEDTERIVRRSLPSASVHRGVTWSDPETGTNYENDVVAVIGTHALIFEAKSGKLAAASRRGGLKSLRTNFSELFGEPGEQATRLEALLSKGAKGVQLLDREGVVVRIDTSKPSVVHKFGLCFEQFVSVTSSRRLFRNLGLLRADQDWAPILTLAELRMISSRLDSEISFLHYLTRRSTIDDMLDFIADEQDLLSMYLLNGFAIDAGALEGRQVTFLAADAVVRGRAHPRQDRTEFATPGITLSPNWRLIAKEIYESNNRHRFDIIVSILNQNPSTLANIEARVRRWRSGAGRGPGNTLSTRAVIGNRVFVIAVHMSRALSFDAETWVEQARMIALDLAEKLGATDCVVILKTRRSPHLTFDGINFFRIRPSRPTSAFGMPPIG
jgi:hypothetical protein